MVILIFALLLVLTFTALAIERILKDLRTQNKMIIKLLSKNNNQSQ